MGKRWTAIYRRAVTTDILEKMDDVTPLIKAVREQAVCLVGHFRTQIIHNKIIFEVLRKPETLSMLTEREQKFVLDHVPITCRLREGNFDFKEVVKNKEKWLIKTSGSVCRGKMYMLE